MRYVPTVDQILALNPCSVYTRERVEALLAQGFTVETLLTLSKDDARWVIARLMTREQAAEWARWCALQVVHLWECPEVVKRYLETGDELAPGVFAALVRPDEASAAWAAWAAGWTRWAKVDWAPQVAKAACAAKVAAQSIATEHRRQIEKAVQILNGG